MSAVLQVPLPSVRVGLRSPFPFLCSFVMCTPLISCCLHGHTAGVLHACERTHLRGRAHRFSCSTCARTHVREWASTPAQTP
jgi:hypothetical protein